VSRDADEAGALLTVGQVLEQEGMLMLLDTALEYALKNRERQLEELKTFLRCRSVSASKSNEDYAGMKKASLWLVNALQRLRMENTKVGPDSRFVYGESLQAPGKPTLLFYGHYDLQEPKPGWQTPPFEPTIKEDRIFALGAADMKSSLWAFFQAIQAIIKSGGLPLNLKIFLDGGQQIGAKQSCLFIDNHCEQMKCDAIISLDGACHAIGIPRITIGRRGLAYFEIEIRGPRKDLHSGRFGGVVRNPTHVLCALVAGMHDEKGRVTLPGFYDSIPVLTHEERHAIGEAALDETEYKKLTGMSNLDGEEGYTPEEQVVARPAIDVSAIAAGSTNEWGTEKGVSTSIPCKASAKIGVRLVANQDPDSVHQQFRRYVEQRCPPGMEWNLQILSRAYVVRSNLNTPCLVPLKRALKESFGTEPLMGRTGASEPFLGHFQQKLGMGAIEVGFKLPDSSGKGPNENQHLPTLFKGIDSLIRFLVYIGDNNTGDA